VKSIKISEYGFYGVLSSLDSKLHSLLKLIHQSEPNEDLVALVLQKL